MQNLIGENPELASEAVSPEKKVKNISSPRLPPSLFLC